MCWRADGTAPWPAEVGWDRAEEPGLALQRPTVRPASISSEGRYYCYRRAAARLLEVRRCWRSGRISTPLLFSRMEHGMTTTADHGQHERMSTSTVPTVAIRASSTMITSTICMTGTSTLHDGHQHAEHSGHYDEHGDSGTGSMPT